MTPEQINKVYDILVEEAGASDRLSDYGSFLANWPECREYRFMGTLGFGGKVWYLPHRSAFLGEQTIYVSCYPEDETPERRAIIERTNKRLAEVLA